MLSIISFNKRQLQKSKTIIDENEKIEKARVEGGAYAQFFMNLGLANF